MAFPGDHVRGLVVKEVSRVLDSVGDPKMAPKYKFRKPLTEADIERFVLEADDDFSYYEEPNVTRKVLKRMLKQILNKMFPRHLKSPKLHLFLPLQVPE